MWQTNQQKSGEVADIFQSTANKLQPLSLERCKKRANLALQVGSSAAEPRERVVAILRRLDDGVAAGDRPDAHSGGPVG